MTMLCRTTASVSRDRNGLWLRRLPKTKTRPRPSTIAFWNPIASPMVIKWMTTRSKEKMIQKMTSCRILDLESKDKDGHSPNRNKKPIQRTREDTNVNSSPTAWPTVISKTIMRSKERWIQRMILSRTPVSVFKDKDGPLLR